MLRRAACTRDLVPRPGIEPGPPTLGAWSLTHWTTREVPEDLIRGEDDYNSNNHYLLHTFYLALCHILCILYILSYSVFTAGYVHYLPHFSDEETEAGSGEGTCQKYPM